MFLSKRPTLIAALLVLLALPATLAAQTTAGDTSRSEVLTEQYYTLRGNLLLAFWNARLSEYRQEIDRMLSAPDRMKVTELRVRAALLLDRMRRIQEKERREYEEAAAADTATMMATEAASTQPDTMMTYDSEYESGYAEAAAAEASVDYDSIQREQERLWEIERQENQRRRIRQLELVLGGDENAAAELVTRSEFRDRSARSNERFMITEEMSEIRYVAQWIARNYRSDMDKLVDRFIADYNRYIDTSRLATREFYQNNRAEIVQDPGAIEMLLTTLLNEEKPDELLNGGTHSLEVRASLESAFMAFSGQDLGDLMMLRHLELPKQFVKHLPARGHLGQNSPDPATARTVIPYMLNESGGSVVVEVLDTRGTVVATFDQGSREPGEHFADIDVTTLPRGTYLYQLRVATATGERLYTRTLNVAR